jgi:hypothetical protein
LKRIKLLINQRNVKSICETKENINYKNEYENESSQLYTHGLKSYLVRVLILFHYSQYSIFVGCALILLIFFNYSIKASAEPYTLVNTATTFPNGSIVPSNSKIVLPSLGVNSHLDNMTVYERRAELSRLAAMGATWVRGVHRGMIYSQCLTSLIISS